MGSYIDSHPEYADLRAPAGGQSPGRIGRMDY
jgi:hypothetical protein